jgi:hypothetical protein
MPVTPDFAVVNCEPTVTFSILASYLFDLLSTLADVSIMGDKQVNVKSLGVFFSTKICVVFCRYRKLTS